MELCVLKKILTHGAFGNHITEVTFSEPVVLTTARVGAVPSSTASQQHTQLLLFAQDAGAPASARFLQLCPGFEQRQSGTRVVQLQPCVTTRVLLRGWYQTVPLSLYGHPLEQQAGAAVEPAIRQHRVMLAGALEWLQEQQKQAKQQQQQWNDADAACWQDAPLQPAVAAVLSQMVAYWDLVGISERLMALKPVPSALFRAAAAVADSICAQLIGGSFGREPVPVAAAQPAPSQEPQQQQQQQQAAEQQQGGEQGEGGVAMKDALQPAAAAPPHPSDGGQHTDVPAMATVVASAAASNALSGDDLLDAAGDMVLGWCGMLGAGAAGRTSAAVRCSTAGLAAAVLLCSCGGGARRMVARWGVVVLDDILTMPGAPPSFTRYSVSACLLIARCCGTLGAASLLGLWRPAHGIVWQTRRRQEHLAVGASATSATQAGSRGEAVGAEAEAECLAAMDENEDFDAEAVGELEQHLYASRSEGEEEEAESQEEEADAEHADLLQQHWQQEQRRRDNTELLFGNSGSDSDSGGGRDFDGYAGVVPHEEEGVQAAADQCGQRGGYTQSPVASGAATGHSVELVLPQQEQQDSEAAPAQVVTMEAEEFGSDVYADLTLAQQEQAPLDGMQPGTAAQLQAAPAVEPIAEAGIAVAAALEDDLYGELDLGLGLGLGATIPQMDGTADSPPRQRHSRGADPAERWALGDVDDTNGAYECSPTEEHSSRRQHKDRSSERGKKQHKDKDSRQDKGRSRERREGRRGCERGDGEDRPREKDRDAAQLERDRTARQQREAEEEWRRRDAEERQQRRQEEESQQRHGRQEEEGQQRRGRQEEEGQQRRGRQEEGQQRRGRQEEEGQQRRGRQEEEGQQRRGRQQEEDKRRQRQQEEEDKRRQQRQQEERRWQQQEEEERKRRYQEQQRQLEEEQRRLEWEEQRKQPQREEEQRRKLQGEEVQRQQSRKRERSPATKPGPGGRRSGEPEGKQARTDKGTLSNRDVGNVAAGPELVGPPQKQQQRRRQQAATLAPPQDEAGKWEVHEQQQRQRMRRYWELKEKAYEGCAPHLARHLLLDVQPQRLALLSRQLLHLLRAHEAAASFQAAAEDLVAAHQQRRRRAMSTPEVGMLVAGCSSSLEQLAELLAKPLPCISANKASTGDPRPAGMDLPPPLLEALSSRRLLPLLAAVLHVPTMHRAKLEQQQPLQAAAAQQAAVMEAALRQQLAVGAKALLVLLASSRGGRRLLLGDAAVLEQLLLATDADCLAVGWPAPPGADGAAMLQHLVIAEAVVKQLCSGRFESEVVAVAADMAVALLHEYGASGRRALRQALALQAHIAVPRLLLMLHMHCTLLRAACGVCDTSHVAALQQQQDEAGFELLLAAAPPCAHAPQLLLALMAGAHPDLLGSWQEHAAMLQLAGTAELRQLEALPLDTVAAVAGLGAAKSALASLKGAAAAVLALQQQGGGLSTLLTYLGAELPALVEPPLPSAAADEDGEGRPHATTRTVRWSAVEELFCNPEKLARCEQCLRLLASLLWAPGAAGRATAYAADAEGAVSVLLRGVLTGVELAEASAADDCWQVLAGQCIDVGEAAACRQRALSFLGAAVAAMSCLLQHLRGSTCPLKSPSLLVGLLRAHAVLCCQEESLSCMLGGTSRSDEGAGSAAQAGAEGMEVALAARYHLASCLRCYVEAAQPWQPLLLQQVFGGTPAPALEPGQVAAQTPIEMFATACLLGDLFPAEWPAAGRKATQAPPSDRKYRAALATAIEPCGAAFRRLIAAALTSESRLLRAAVVRVLARAAGLGGGMGPFLVEPLLEELQTVAESPAPLHDARRLLEVIVPLSYRPAIKSAMLSASFTSTLAQLLGVVVGKLLSTDEGSEALHVCTMVMEAVVVLFNHEVCLNPLASKEQQQLEDMPPVAEAVPMARALLELLPGMGSNAMIAHRVLRLMAAAESGRQALRRAVVAVHAAATGAEPSNGQPGTIAVAQAAQWVANRYWAAAERLGGDAAAGAPTGGLEGLHSIYTDIVAIMQQICVAADEEVSGAPSSAQQRFVAALQAALQAAAAAGLDVGGNEHRWEAPGTAESCVVDLVHDPATRMFWRNVRARAATQSQASSAHAMRRFARRDCQTDMDLSLEASLHPPLTLPSLLHTEPPIVEHSQQLQQPKPEASGAAPATVGPMPVEKVVDEQQPSMAAAATASVQAPAMKSEHVMLQRLESAPGQQTMDLYSDLSLALHLRASGSVSSNVAAAATTGNLRQQRQMQQHAASHPTTQQKQGSTDAAAPMPLQQPAPRAEVMRQTSGNTGSGSLQALLASPAALQALLKDPAQLQRVLEKHPGLISVLKSKLG